MRKDSALGSATAWPHVPEPRIGKWFLQTDTWSTHVLHRAIEDLDRLIPARYPSYPEILDVGCGWGLSFPLLAECFSPRRLTGIEIDPALVREAAAKARKLDL